MKIQELNNQEVAFIHLIIDDIHGSMMEILENKGIDHFIDTPFGKGKIFIKASAEKLELLKTGLKYEVLRTLKTKLDPIMELISEAEPDMIKDLENSLFSDINDTYEQDGENGSEEEDL